MLTTENPSEGLLFASFLYRSDLFTDKDFQTLWEDHFGQSFSLLPKVNPLNSYYEKEMGTHLSRIFFLTSKTFPREFLLASKLQAINWEKGWAPTEQRRVNVDIGFLSAENFLLATTKNYSHRVYIGQNIFADLTYHFHKGAIEALPWTYPDYLDQEKKDFFNWGRSYLLQSRA